MNITKDYFEKQLKKHDKVTVYSPENIPLNIGKEFYIARDGSNPTLEFEFNCEDLALCLSIRNCIKRAPKSTVPCQHRFGFEKPCFCSL